ncbi:MAG: RnfABCDGE type electron transport complex subunit D [Treponema sp.]|nr:RnfABCDGE type electron transport complex subunit D [Treponema sp.]
MNLTVSFAPHIRGKESTSRIMLDVIIALLPALLAAIWVFGPRAALVTGVCVFSCVFFEWSYEKLLNRKNSITDYSAALTGIILAYNLPVTIPMWQAVFGCFVAVILVKQLFGGLGKNFANPAVTARVVMFLAFPVAMTTWVSPLDAVTTATPLVNLHHIFKGEPALIPGTLDLFLGIHGGCLGETSDLALLIGFAYLLVRHVISPTIPLVYIASVFVMMFIAGGFDFGIYQIFSGGLFLGAIFCATDYVTSPQTESGRAIFAFGCALVTVIIRLFGSYPEGVSFAIIFMNMLVPYINKLTYRKALGGNKS